MSFKLTLAPASVAIVGPRNKIRDKYFQHPTGEIGKDGH